jgi:transposase
MIIRLKNDGMKCSDIARLTNLPKQTISEIVKKGKYKVYRPKSGRPMINTEQKMREIGKLLKIHRQRGVRRITAELKCRWSKSTTHRRLRDAGWEKKNDRHPPILSELRKKQVQNSPEATFLKK